MNRIEIALKRKLPQLQRNMNQVLNINETNEHEDDEDENDWEITNKE